MKPFSWSYSRLKNFETCPKRHYHYDVAKDVKEPDSEQLFEGNTLHKQAADYLSNGKELPSGRKVLKSWCDRILAGCQALNAKLLVEQKLAITSDFGACPWFGDQAWFRAIGDVVAVSGDGSVGLIVDWKTGKILEDSCQLALAAACVFAHYPSVQRVRSEFVWLAHDANTPEVFTRQGIVDMWRSVWPRIAELKRAYETQSYPAKPGRLCRKWCAVEKCPHHGE